MPPGRPVSSEAFERLAAYLDGEHAGMSPEHRRQSSVLAARLRVDDNVPALRKIARARLGVAQPLQLNATSQPSAMRSHTVRRKK